MIRTVSLSADAKKDIKTCPNQIIRKLMAWVGSIQRVGLDETRKSPGWHDELLKGKWAGYRSVRLNIAYRAIYRITKNGALDLVLVETVNKHKY